MSRGALPKIKDSELLKYLSDQEYHTNMEISVVFSCTPQTAQKHVKILREDGHAIVPTSNGQRYVKRIKKSEDLDEVMAVIDWTAKIKTGMRSITKVVKPLLETAPEAMRKIG